MNKWVAAVILVLAVIVFFSGMVLGFRLFGEALQCVMAFAGALIIVTAAWLLFTRLRS